MEPRARAVSRTPKLSDLLKGGDTSQNNAGAKPEEVVVITAREPFTPEQFHTVWLEFAEQRKKFQIEYQLLMQPYILQAEQVTIMLYSPIQETSLNNIRIELNAFLRERMRNGSILVLGEFVKEGETKKMIYTPRERFEYLLEKHPMFRQLKDRLGLDSDF